MQELQAQVDTYFSCLDGQIEILAQGQKGKKNERIVLRTEQESEAEMSFECQQCKRTTGLGEKQYKKVLETRPRKYKNGGVGWEIVKEIAVCQQCKEAKDGEEVSKP